MDTLAILSGFAVGAVVGLTGVDGGSLMTPLLLSVFRLHPAVAIGTDLWFAALTKGAGSVAHRGAGQVDWPVTARLLAGSLPAAGATFALMHATGTTRGWASPLTFALGIALLLTAVVVAYRKTWQRVGLRLERRIPAARKGALTVASGALLGVLVSLSSIGAGAIGATPLMLIHPRMPAHRIVGSDIAHAVPLTLAAGIGCASLGLVDWTRLVALVLDGVPGIWLGAQLTRRMPETLVRALLRTALIAAGLKVIH